MTGRHLLLTNDFPPKVGGIQNYLWELWRRLDPARSLVMCTPHPDAVAFDAKQRFAIERSPEPVLIPYPWLPKRLAAFNREHAVALTLIDPAVPLGAIGPRLGSPYGVVLHGAEVAIPGRLPGASHVLGGVLGHAELVISAGEYALEEAERCAGRSLPAVVIPPGVDHARFHPPSAVRRDELRAARGIAADEVVVAVVTRLVPRKGIDVLVDAVARVAARHGQIRLLIGGDGRDAARLRRGISRHGAPAELLGPLSEEAVVELYQTADVMAMPCNQRWKGLEQEGFGIVFLEAAACGLPQVAGRSGGAEEAVVDGVTGLVVDTPQDPMAVAEALSDLVVDPDRRRQMGIAARSRAVERFDYDELASTLQHAIDTTILRLEAGR